MTLHPTGPALDPVARAEVPAAPVAPQVRPAPQALQLLAAPAQALVARAARPGRALAEAAARAAAMPGRSRMREAVTPARAPSRSARPLSTISQAVAPTIAPPALFFRTRTPISET